MLVIYFFYDSYKNKKTVQFYSSKKYALYLEGKAFFLEKYKLHKFFYLANEFICNFFTYYFAEAKKKKQILS